MVFFRRGILDDYLNMRQKQLEDYIDALPRVVLNRDIDELSAQLATKHSLQVPVFSDEKPEYEVPPLREGQSSVVIPVHVRFEGDAELFECNPRGHSPSLELNADVDEDRLVIFYELYHDHVRELPERIDRHKEQLREGIAKIDHWVRLFNDKLQRIAAERIRFRRREFEKHSQTIETLASSGLKLRRRNDGTESVIIPVNRRQLIRQVGHSKPVTPAEHSIAPESYEDILQVLQSMALVIERSPSVFRKMKEEDLRTILLVGLNGVYEGKATGETFNGQGKIDILIREENRNTFIAECLIWSGERHFRKKLDEQLFQYATWRDSKLAVIIFNRNKEFSRVVAEMRAVLSGHKQCIKELSYKHASGCRFLYRRHDDAEQHFILTGLAFDILK